MFEGFTKETFEFFSAIQFNNNREFFLENRDWYYRAVREPARELAAALGDAVCNLDPLLETRPEKVVSRINRDVRFSNDKSTYRDYIWLAFRRPGVERATTLGVYFDIGAGGCSYGMGYYDENRPQMNALRRQIRVAPESVLAATQSALAEFTLHPKAYKRMAVPSDIPEALRAWYNLRGFYVEKTLTDFGLILSPKLADEVDAGYRRLKKLYDYIVTLTPEEDGDVARAAAGASPRPTQEDAP